MKEEKNIIKNTTENKIKKKNNKKIIIIFVSLIIFILFISTIFAIINLNSNKIISGVSVQGIDISKNTEHEANEKVKAKVKEILKKDIILKYKDYTTSITPEQIELKLNYDDAIKKAQNIGKTRNIIVDNYNILKTNIFKNNIEIDIQYNRYILQDMIKNIK